MRNISIWASRHIWLSRIIIIFLLYPLLNITGWFLGDLLESSGIILSYLWMYPLSAVVFVVFACYPSKQKFASGKNSYKLRKTCDALLAVATFMFIVLTGNQRTSNGDPVTFKANASISHPVVPSNQPSKIKKEKKSLKKWVRNLRKKYRDSSKETKILLSILAVLVAILLIGGLIGLACSLACNGSEAAAWLVFLLGTAGVIFALVKVINAIHGKTKKKKLPPQEISS
jgi:hypothetical protein